MHSTRRFARTAVWLSAAALSGVALAPAQNLRFGAGGTISIAEQFAGALSVAVGDVDRDGKPDLVIATANEIVLVPGSGTSNPLPGRAIFTGKRTTNIVLADFDRDGAPDIAASSPTEGQVLVFKRRGDGSFAQVVSLKTETSEARGLLAIDLNQDGKTDLAAAQDSSIAVFLGDGSGAFTAGPQLQTGQRPQNIISADFNGDRIPDLAVACNPFSDSISILLGSGRGQFQPQRSVSVQDRPYAVEAGDFDRDGTVDLAVAASSGLRVLLGSGDGTFRSGEPVNWNSLPVSVAAGDLMGTERSISCSAATTGARSRFC